MNKLFLLDAYALIYRSYYAFLKNPRINSKGINTSAIFGFINSLEDVLKREQPTHIAIGFDPSGPTFRHEAYTDYKAQREETPEDIRASVPIIKDILEAYHIPVLQADGFEADDVIGTLATAAGREGIETYMLTPDKDYGQLVGGNVYIYRPRHGGGYDTLGESEVTQKYGIATTAHIFIFSKSSAMGTSVLMVARNRLIRMSSTAPSTFSLNLPLISSVCASMLSILPNCVMSFAAVFSPTPGHPGKLSAESSISASRSITWVGESSSYLAHTSLGPIVSYPPP